MSYIVDPDASAAAVAIASTPDFYMRAALGLIAGVETVSKFGSNTDVGASEEDIWAAGGDYPWASADFIPQIYSGASSDGTAGSGCQVVTLLGLDANFAEQSEDITLAGTTTVTASLTFRRVFRVAVKDVGEYGGTNNGAITIRAGAGGGVQALVVAERGQTQLSMYTVPAGYTALLMRIHAVVSKGDTADIAMYQRPAADDVSPPVRGVKLVNFARGVEGVSVQRFASSPVFGEKTDLWFRANRTSGSAASVDVSYDLILFNNTVWGL